MAGSKRAWSPATTGPDVLEQPPELAAIEVQPADRRSVEIVLESAPRREVERILIPNVYGPLMSIDGDHVRELRCLYAHRRELGRTGDEPMWLATPAVGHVRRFTTERAQGERHQTDVKILTQSGRDSNESR